MIFSILNIVGDPRPPQLLGKINASLFLTLEFPHTIFFETVAGQYQNKGLVSFLLILFVSILPFVTSHFQIYSSRLSSPLLISTSSISLRCTCSFLCGWMCVCVCVCVRHTPWMLSICPSFNAAPLTLHSVLTMRSALASDRNGLESRTPFLFSPAEAQNNQLCNFFCLKYRWSHLALINVNTNSLMVWVYRHYMHCVYVYIAADVWICVSRSSGSAFYRVWRCLQRLE